MNRQFELIEQRLKNGQRLMMLELTGLLRNYVRDKAPLIDKYDYSKDLKIGLVPDVDGGIGSIVYFSKISRKLEEIEQNTVVYVNIKPNNPRSKDYIKILSKYNPWPMDLLPIVLTLRDSDNVTKIVSAHEYQNVRTRITHNAGKIQMELRASGLSGAVINSDNSFVSSEVYDDVEFSVLRKEFGILESQQPHWRPALSKLSKDLKNVKEKFITYIETGNESIFDIPNYDKIAKSDLDSDGMFKKIIAKSVTLGKV